MGTMTGPRLRFVRPNENGGIPQSSVPTRTSDSKMSVRGLVVHASWVPPLGEGEHHLAIWAEAEHVTSDGRRRPSPFAADASARVPAHPSTALTTDLHTALEYLWKISRPGVRPRTSNRRARLQMWLPTVESRPLPSPEMVRGAWAADPALEGIDEPCVALTPWIVNALFLDVESAGTLLAGLPHGASASVISGTATTNSPRSNTYRVVLGSDLRLWAAAAKLALDLLVRQRYLPGAITLLDDVSLGAAGKTALMAGTWYASLSDPSDRARFDALAAAMPDLCRAAVTPGAYEPSPERAPAAPALLEDFVHTVVNARVARWIAQDRLLLDVSGPAATTSPQYNVGPDFDGYSGVGSIGSITQRWLWNLMRPQNPMYTTSAEASALLDGVRRWHAGLTDSRASAFRLCFRLSPPDGLPDTDSDSVNGDASSHVTATKRDVAADMAAEPPNSSLPVGDSGAAVDPDGVTSYFTQLHSDSTYPTPAGNDEARGGADQLDDMGTWRLDYLLQARDDLSLLVPLGEVWRERNAVARFLDRRFDHPHERVVAALGQAARLFAPLERSLAEAHPQRCDLTGREAYAFLRDAVALFEEAGFGVLVPAWWRHTAPRLTVRLRLRPGNKTFAGMLGLDAVLSYEWTLALGGQELTRLDLERLVALKEPIVRHRGQWVELRPDQIDAALEFMRAHAGGRMSLGDALRVALTRDVGDARVIVDDIYSEARIGELLDRLHDGGMVREIPQPESLVGTLRPYQRRGLSWLAFLSRHGLGACLADDMGLGKTVELLALVLHLKASGHLFGPVLLVCPTSVVGNWRHETQRFAPSLRVLIHHGADRAARADIDGFMADIAGYDMVITTYSLLHRDVHALNATPWGAVVLDEAQNIKNPDARQSRAARALRAPVRVALTGTPVENRLTELWSIMDFLNPGYLGTHKRFGERFAYPIERLRDTRVTARLQSLVRPFILRRLKTDPDVISDLPDKLEMREYCPLTPEQVTLYVAVVRDGLRQIDVAAGDMERRGTVLAMLSKLKQVCNHPAHFLGDGSALEGRSGKLARLEELVEELLAEGDRALIFTQFTAMGDLLQPYLRERFGTEVLYLHGGVSQVHRERMVARFQSEDGPPLFLLSLKAGGVGLNLTRANHVIHFDRWWNPAVENQATDRAFRIGQTRNVQVRKFVCVGTLEERIDAMIEQKRELAEVMSGAGEGWITEMTTDQLRDVFDLRADALAE
jgi:SNF2 domain-containing protein/SNF2 helicase protein/helicase-like protein